MRLGEKFGTTSSRSPAAGPVLKEVLDKHLQGGGNIDNNVSYILISLSSFQPFNHDFRHFFKCKTKLNRFSSRIAIRNRQMVTWAAAQKPIKHFVRQGRIHPQRSYRLQLQHETAFESLLRSQGRRGVVLNNTWRM